MAVENSQSINIESKKVVSTKQVETSFKVETNNEKAIKKIVNVFCSPKITSSEKIGDNLTFSVVNEYNVVYLTEENEIKSIFALQELKDNLNFSSEKDYFVNIELIDCQVVDFSQSEIVVAGLLNVEVSAINQDLITTVFNLTEDYVVVEKNHKYNKVVNTVKENIVEVNEKELDYKVDEVLYNNAAVKVLNVSAGIDMIYLDAEVRVVSHVVSEGEIKAVSNNFNIRQEFAALGVIPESIIELDLKLISNRVVASTGEIDQKTNLVYTVELKADAVVYAIESVNIIEDAFSIRKKSTINTEYLLKTTFLGQSNSVINTAALVELERNVDKVLYPIVYKTNITNFLEVDEKTKVFGAVELGFVCIDEMGQTVLLKNYAPIEVIVDKLGDSNKIELESNLSLYKLKNKSEVDLDLEVNVVVKNYEDEYIMSVSKINELEDHEKCDEAVNVYVVDDKEKLFDIAKKLCVKPDDILNQNNINEQDIVKGTRLIIYHPLDFNF